MTTSNTTSGQTRNTSWTFKYEIPWCATCQDWHQPRQPHTRPPIDGSGYARHRRPPNQPPSSDAKLQAALRVLGLSIGATSADIRAAYREKMKIVHPDLGGDADEAKRVNAAMEELRERGLA